MRRPCQLSRSMWWVGLRWCFWWSFWTTTPTTDTMTQPPVLPVVVGVWGWVPLLRTRIHSVPSSSLSCGWNPNANSCVPSTTIGVPTPRYHRHPDQGRPQHQQHGAMHQTSSSLFSTLRHSVEPTALQPSKTNTTTPTNTTNDTSTLEGYSGLNNNNKNIHHPSTLDRGNTTNTTVLSTSTNVSMPFISTGRWVADGLALLIATELQGLIQVVTDPTFVAQGGWMQPILSSSTGSSTLPLWVQRCSLDCLVWALSLQGTVYGMGFLTSSSRMKSRNEDNRLDSFVDTKTTHGSDSFQGTVTAVIVFGIVRLGVAVLLAGSDPSLLANDSSQPSVLLQGLVDTYYVALAVLTRHILSNRYATGGG